MSDFKKSVEDVVKRKIANLKLNSLLEVTKAINNNQPTEVLYEIYLDILVNKLNLGKLSLYTNEHGHWSCALKQGLNKSELAINVEKDLLPIRDISAVNLLGSVSSDVKLFDIVIPVYHKLEALAFVLIGDIDDNKMEMSPVIKHLPFVQTLTNIIIVAVENKRLAREYISQIAARKELDLAREMQSMLFPSELPDNPHISAHAFYQPHQQVGGDYYDCLRLNENEFAFCVADVSGKGVSAALLMANFQANLRALFKNNASLRDIVNDLNAIIYNNAKGEKFITLFIAKYNIVTRMLTYVNAGHNPSLLHGANSAFYLTTGCIGVGMFPEIPKIREGVVHVSPGSVIISYTDGLVEQSNQKQEEFGLKRLEEIVRSNMANSVKKLNISIINTIDKFREGLPYADDIALLSFYVN
jgi:phosphoserine phosphatase RsbU/P